MAAPGVLDDDAHHGAAGRLAPPRGTGTAAVRRGESTTGRGRRESAVGSRGCGGLGKV